MKDKIIQLLREGATYNEIVASVGCSKATISYHADRVGLKKFNKKRYDWSSIQDYHNNGKTRLECIAEFGFSKASWDDARKRGDLVPGEWKIPISELLVEGRNTSRNHLKKRLIREGYLEYSCNECKISKWRRKSLSLQLEHKNGVSNDNRLSNLCLLCPNCHSQTSTFAGRNKKYKSIAE